MIYNKISTDTLTCLGKASLSSLLVIKTYSYKKRLKAINILTFDFFFTINFRNGISTVLRTWLASKSSARIRALTEKKLNI